MNKQWRVSSRSGWLTIFTGESQGAALERIIPEVNSEGYRIVFIIPDRWSFARSLANLALACVTFFAFFHAPGYVIIGEQVS